MRIRSKGICSSSDETEKRLEVCTQGQSVDDKKIWDRFRCYDTP